MHPIACTDLFSSLPDEWGEDLRPHIAGLVKTDGRKVVVLDDDPTGTQTVHGIPVLTRWTLESLQVEMAGGQPAFYLLTNSRSMPLPQSQRLHRQIARLLDEAASRARRQFVVVSRSDSTLRGHFPEEVDTLAAALDRKFDGWILCPFFAEGGRYTVEDRHYVSEGSQCIPVAQTTRQLNALLAAFPVVHAEVSVKRLLQPSQRRGEINRVTNRIDDELSAGKDIVVYTSRSQTTYPNDGSLS